MSEIDTNGLFIQASRTRLRFSSVNGDLTVEDLWDLPLTGNLSLEAIGNKLLAQQRSFTDSILSRPSGDSVAKQRCDLSVENLRHVARTREAEIEAKTTELARATERARLDGLIRNREGAELSIDELRAQREALSN